MKYGLLGEYLSHSYSCDIHALLADYTYELCEMSREELSAFLTKKEFCAVNVTIPYKQTVIPYLDEISDTARKIGAVNTIVNQNGRLYGDNTDFAGMRALLRKIGISLSGKKVLILGTGGTSKTAHAVAESMGAASIVTVSRSGTGGISYEDAALKHSDTQILINTTPAGMFPHVEGQAISLVPFPRLEAVVDAVYNPLRTDLILEAQARGIPAEGGLYMLSAQAVYASALFRGVEPNIDDIERAYLTVRNRKRNIVLIGMPSCGKTTVGQLLAEKTGMAFRDTDAEIIQNTGMPIADFFDRHGEEAFRNRESEVISELSLTNGHILATGGGAIIRGENVRALRRNGILVFLDRSPENLLATADRPLSANREALKKRYSERYDRYCAAADIRIDGNQSLQAVAEALWKEVTQ